MENKKVRRKNSLLIRLRRGFTLVEVIIALALMGIAALAFVTVMMGSYNLQFKQKGITKNAFELQKDIERQIEEKRQNIDSLTFKTFNSAFGVSGLNVEYFPIKVKGKNHIFYSLITKEQQLVQTLPVATMASLNIDNTLNPTRNYNYDYIPNENLGIDYKIAGKYQLKPDTLDNIAYVVVYWYASKPGYSVPTTPDIAKSDLAECFPMIPDDFEMIHQQIIPADKRVTSGVVEFPLEYARFRGRHIIMNVVPATGMGVLGKGVYSNMVFIDGLSEFDNLVAHLDASLIQKANLQGENLVSWRDLSNPNPQGGGRILQGSASLIPGYKDTSYPGFGVKLEKQTIIYSAANTGDVLAIVIAKDDFSKDNLYMENAELVGDRISISDNFCLYIFKGQAKKGYYGEGYVGIMNWNNPDPIEILEFIAYSGSYSEEELKDLTEKATEYARGKFVNEVIGVAKISKIPDIKIYAQPGQEVKGPETVTALFDNGKRRAVYIDWNKADLDSIELINLTGEDKEYTVVGKVVDDETVSCKMTVVMPHIPLKVTLEIPKDQILKSGEIEVKYTVEADFPEPVTLPSNIAITFKCPEELLKFKAKEEDELTDELTLEGVEGKFIISGAAEGMATVTASYGVSTREVAKLEVLDCPVVAKGLVVWLDSSSTEYMDTYPRGNEIYLTTMYDRSLNGNDFTKSNKGTGRFIECLPGGGIEFKYDNHYLYKEAGSLGKLDFSSGQPNSTIIILYKPTYKTQNHLQERYKVIFSQASTTEPRTAFRIADFSKIEKENNKNKQINQIRIKTPTSYEIWKRLATNTNNPGEMLTVNSLSENKQILVNINKLTKELYPSGGFQDYDFDCRLIVEDIVTGASLDETVNMTSGLSNLNEKFTIGRSHEGFRHAELEQFYGVIYEVLIYDRELSGEEVDDVMEYLENKWK